MEMACFLWPVFLLCSAHSGLCNPRLLFWKEARNRPHGQEQAAFYFGQRNETIPPIKPRRRIIFGINNDSRRCQLLTPAVATAKSVHQQKFACALPAKSCADGETPQ